MSVLTCPFIIAARFLKAVDDGFSKSFVNVLRTDLKDTLAVVGAAVVGAAVIGAAVVGEAVVDMPVVSEVDVAVAVVGAAVVGAVVVAGTGPSV